ncbi:MAG: prolyl aminopeptidase [Alphaproteobacteria bacterium]|nr:prolyl aminopeptidase [Alphaproteobacteria bacterium]
MPAAKKILTPRSFYPEIKPYEHGMLDVGDGHRIYWETCGNPKGKPALFLHGGPGAGCSKDHRRLFDPKRYRIILFDQRGCGRSTPHARLEANTTAHLIADIEKLRALLGVDRWLVLGGSWGSTLALAYAEAFPKRVRGLILRGVFTAREKELAWFYQEGASLIFPEAWSRFVSILSVAERKNIVQSYTRRFASKNLKKKMEAVRAWANWERETLSLLSKKIKKRSKADDAFALAIALIEHHYFINKAFLEEGQLLQNAKRLKNIPGIIINGRYDVICPPTTAWELHQKWPTSCLVMIPDAGHAYSEQGTLDATIAATDFFAKEF